MAQPVFHALLDGTSGPDFTQYVAAADGVTDDAPRFQAAIDAATVKGGKVVAPAGAYAVAETIDMKSNVTVSCPWGGVLDGGTVTGGTRLLWTGTTGVVLKYLDTEYTVWDGLHIDCQNQPATAVLIDWDHAQDSIPSHDNRLENVWLGNGKIGIQIGNSGASGYQCDGVIINNFKLYSFTDAFLRINSQNAAQNTYIQRGFFQQYLANSSAPMIDLQYTPHLFRLSELTFGAVSSYSGAAVYSRYANGSGGQPMIMQNCSFEIQAPGYAYLSPSTSIESARGIEIWIGNSFWTSRVQVDGKRFIISIGNQFQDYNANVTHPESVVISIGDRFTAGNGWVPSGGARVINLSFDEMLQFVFSGTSPGLWSVGESLRPGSTGLERTGDLALKDVLTGRELMILSKATSGVGFGAAVNSHMTHGDISVRRHATGGAVFFGDGYDYLEFGLRGTGAFTFSGPLAVQDTIARIHSGAGSPEGSVGANQGSVYMRLDGGTGSTLYVKESGSGTTGWRAL